MIRYLPLGLDEALSMMLERIVPLDPEDVDLMNSVDRIAARDLHAAVNSPSVDASLKDGYAVVSDDIKEARPGDPVRLRLIGVMAAGGREDIEITSGSAVRILTGARIPAGANAVVSEEFVEQDGGCIRVLNNAEPGRNILLKGSDVALNSRIIAKGDKLSPGMTGILAAAGHSAVPCVRLPSVAIVATGDEVVAPGKPLPEGKLYASNITTLGGWCRRYRMHAALRLVKDDADELHQELKTLSLETDAIITSGGAWTGDRDMVARVLERLGWEQVFHRIRIGPGKAVGFGMLSGKPVFILPGGPPSNLMGFLQIALPGLLKLGGHARPGLPSAPVRLAEDIVGRHEDWTQFIFGMIERNGDTPVFHSLKGESRLRSMAEAMAVAMIPEGRTVIHGGTVVQAQILE